MEPLNGAPAAGNHTNGHHRLTKPGQISRGHVNGARVSSERIHTQTNTNNHQSPCTDFDVAYFQSYNHLGIHEEMIKVCVILIVIVIVIVMWFDFVFVMYLCDFLFSSFRVLKCG